MVPEFSVLRKLGKEQEGIKASREGGKFAKEAKKLFFANASRLCGVVRESHIS